MTPRQAGPLTTLVTARADGGLSDVARQTVTVKRAEVGLRNTGPAWRYVGRPADWSIEVQNKGEVPLTGAAQSAVERAGREASSMGAEHVDCNHILLALVGDPDGAAARILRQLDVDPAAVRSAVAGPGV